LNANRTMGTRLLALLLGAVAIPSSATPQTQTRNSATVRRSDSSAALTGAPAKAVATAKLHANYGKLPLSFEPNRGQAGQGVKFLARGSGYALQLTPGGAVLALSKHSPDSALSRSSQNPGADGSATLRWRLLGANPAPEISGESLLPGTVSYYSGANAANWLTNVPTYARVRYRSVLPGVDLVYYGHGRQLEYDFVVAPGANPKCIRLRFDGAAAMRVDSSGNLVVPLSGSDVRFKKPVVYQEKNGKRRHVSGSYELHAKNRVGFRIGAYDRQLPLVIDPVLDYATYYGGPDRDSVNAIAVDAAGNAFVAGETLVQRAVPLPGACPGGQTCPTSDVDAIVSKIDPTGSTVLWTVLVGGSGTDVANAITLDNQGNVFVAGSTTSNSLPTGIGFDPTCGTDGTCGEQTFQFPRTDGFVMKLAPNSVFQSGTYLGGNLEDEILGMAVDASGVYLTGHSNAGLNDFPLVNPASSTSSFNDIFVAKFTPDLSQLVYSTLFGQDRGNGIAVNALGEAFVVGQSRELAFTTPNAYQSFPGGKNVFLFKLSADGASVPYATYLYGGDSPSAAFAVALDSVGKAYLTGETSDEFFPMVNSFQPTMVYRSDRDGHVFVAIIDTSLSGAASLVYSTYLGAGGRDVGRAIALDAAGNVYVAGHTKNYLSDPTDPQFPLVNSLRPCLDPGIDAQGNWRDFENPFLAILNPSGSALLFSTCLGSDTERDQALALALDPSGSVYLGGWTQSAQFPVTPGVHGTTYGGNQDGIVAKLSGLLLPPSVSISIDDVQASEGNSGTTQFTFNVTLSAVSGNAVTVDFATADGAAATSDNDYAATNGTLTFAPGETVKTITVDVTGDTNFEPDENFFVDLTNASGAAIAKAQGLGNIQNDDANTVTITIQEDISVTDTPGVQPSAMLAVNESIAVTDAPGVLPSAMIGINEAITVMDAPALLPSAMIAVNENVVVTDTLQITPVLVNQPPAVNAGPDQSVEATSPAGAQVSLSGFGNDPDGDSLLFAWNGPFGTLTGASISPVLSLGTHTLTLTADDGNGHLASDTVNITVQDTTAPALTLPANMNAIASSAAGTAVIFLASATDLVSGTVIPSCVPASGGIFVIGTTTVNCTAADGTGNLASGSFTVTVNLGTPRLAGSIVGNGRDSAGNYFVDLKLANTGTGHARNAQITGLPLRTLSGTGTVTHNAGLSGPLPMAAGSIDAGASVIVRIFLNVPGTVTRFSITENGSLKNVAGTSSSFSLAQSVIP
jgi:hypothetical protein